MKNKGGTNTTGYEPARVTQPRLSHPGWVTRLVVHHTQAVTQIYHVWKHWISRLSFSDIDTYTNTKMHRCETRVTQTKGYQPIDLPHKQAQVKYWGNTDTTGYEPFESSVRLVTCLASHHILLFFVTLGLESSDTKSLRTLNTSHPRNCFSSLRSNSP